MSRKARVLPSPTPDDTSVSMTERWHTLFSSEPPKAAGLVAQAVAWKEQVSISGDVAPAIARDLAIAARHASETRSRRLGVAPPSPALIEASCLSGEPSSEAPCLGSGPPSEANRLRSEDQVTVAASPSPPPAPLPSEAKRLRSRAAVAPLPPASSQLLPGTRLVKSHGGRNHVVEVTGSGFVYEGEQYASLSAVAKHITGTHWNGLLFFGLRRRKTYPAKAASHG